jgi:hypothetical protein
MRSSRELVHFTCRECGVDASKQRRSWNANPVELCKSCLTKSVRSRYELTNFVKRGVASPLKKSGIHSPFRRYSYDGVTLDNQWQLAFYIYHIDHDLYIEKKKKSFEYSAGKSIHSDFIIERGLIAIIGGSSTEAADYIEREECYKEHNIRVLYHHDIMPFVEYVYSAHGREHMSKMRTVN